MMAKVARAAVLMFIAGATAGYSQDRGTSLPEVVRGQLMSLAGAVLDSSGIRPGTEVVLIVESQEEKTIVENAFLASFQVRDIRGALPDSAATSTRPLLRISDVQVNRAGGDNRAQATEGGWTTELDARIEDHALGSVRYLGHFVRSDRSGSISGDSQSIFGKILEPLVVISGTVLIVYLFFTVRS